VKVEYSPLAREDLRDILEYGHQHWGAAAAYDFIAKLEKNFELFTQNPQAGRRLKNPHLTDADGEIRCFGFGNYQIVYEPLAKQIIIHGIIPKDRPRAGST